MFFGGMVVVDGVVFFCGGVWSRCVATRYVARFSVVFFLKYFFNQQPVSRFAAELLHFQAQGCGNPQP